MRKKTILSIALAAICLFSGVQATLAAWRVSDPSIHAISIASLSGRLVEVYTEQDQVFPGQTVEKIVNVKNTGSSDSVIRIKLEKQWGKSRTEDGALIPEEGYDTDNILIDYNTELWYYNEADDYYYYKGVLRPGETTSAALFESFKIANETPAIYNNMTADIVVKLECLQAAAHAISIWDMSFEELGITYVSSNVDEKVTKVDFEGKRFTFDPNDTDLFANFKNLLPGETRTQIISVKNSASFPAEIFLRAEIVDQFKATPETIELINRLLKEYVTIVVTEPDGTVVYSGPVWGEPLLDVNNPQSMRYDFSLGNFLKGENKDLTIQLQVNPLVDNEYQSLWGYIKWVWTAQGEDGKVETPILPQTGDTSQMYLYFGIMLVSGFFLLVLIRLKQREDAKNKQFNRKQKLKGRM